MRRTKLFLCILFLLCWTATVHAERLVLRVPPPPDGNQSFFHELLQEAFAAIDHPAELHWETGMTRERMQMMMLSGDLDIMWMVRGPKRDQLFVPVDFPLTRGLIGQRILLIRPKDQALFDRIENLDDFRRLGLVAGMGRDWIDVDIWKLNALPVNNAVPIWSLLFRMLAAGNRNVDYVPRGAMEVHADIQANPDLAIEKRLILRYDRDNAFYVSPRAADLVPKLKRGLEILHANGTYARLLEKYYGDVERELNLSARTVLSLRDAEEDIN